MLYRNFSIEVFNLQSSILQKNFISHCHMYFKFLFLFSSLILNLSSLMIQVIMIPVNQF